MKRCLKSLYENQNRVEGERPNHFYALIDFQDGERNSSFAVSGSSRIEARMNADDKIKELGNGYISGIYQIK